MKYYAHRGNICGANPARENKIDYINEALKFGHCVEIDVRLLNGEYYLGHDKAQEKIPKEFMIDDRILVHAKTYETFRELLKCKRIHSFYQDNENVVISSWGKKVHHEDLKTTFDYTEDDIFVNLDGYVSHKNAYGRISDTILELPKKTDFFKLLILDVDGVLTNGRKTYNVHHEVISKEFCDKDFTAIKRFQSAEIEVLLLSGDRFNIGMANSRHIPFWNAKDFSKQLDKHKAALEISKRYRISLDDIAYVGDDYYDLSLLDYVGYSYCPSDAAEIVKNSVKTVINRKGGEGVVEGLYELVKDKIIQRFPYEL